MSTIASKPLSALAALGAGAEDPLADRDLQLALYLCYELHYRGFPGVDPDWEWSPQLIAVRRGNSRAGRQKELLRGPLGG